MPSNKLWKASRLDALSSKIVGFSLSSNWNRPGKVLAASFQNWSMVRRGLSSACRFASRVGRPRCPFCLTKMLCDTTTVSCATKWFTYICAIRSASAALLPCNCSKGYARGASFRIGIAQTAPCACVIFCIICRLILLWSAEIT